jgi:hypothetical protein
MDPSGYRGSMDPSGLWGSMDPLTQFFFFFHRWGCVGMRPCRLAWAKPAATAYTCTPRTDVRQGEGRGAGDANRSGGSCSPAALVAAPVHQRVAPCCPLPLPPSPPSPRPFCSSPLLPALFPSATVLLSSCTRPLCKLRVARRLH